MTVLVVTRPTQHRPELWFAAGAAVTGLVLMAILGHPGAGQLYFPLSASVVIGVVSAWGLGEALGHLSSREVATAVLVGVAAGTAGLALPQWLVLAPPYATWLLSVLLVLGMLVFATARRSAYAGRDLLVMTASLAAWALVTASLTSGQDSLKDTIRAGWPAAAAANAPNAWTPAHTAALVWLRDHAAQDDVVATNRQCSVPQLGDAACGRWQSRWFLTAALGRHRMYIEGAEYAVVLLPRLSRVDERINLSRRFVDQPSSAEAKVLWDKGVRWVLVDLASTMARSWTPYALPAFATETSVVLRLVRP
jgi:hypothetical protein